VAVNCWSLPGPGNGLAGVTSMLFRVTAPSSSPIVITALASEMVLPLCHPVVLNRDDHCLGSLTRSEAERAGSGGVVGACGGGAIGGRVADGDRAVRGLAAGTAQQHGHERVAVLLVYDSIAREDPRRRHHGVVVDDAHAACLPG
jgi:hypothetical protein